MTRARSVLVSVLFVLSIAAALGVGGRVSAGTGCFADTNGHPFETFICWMNDNGISGGIGGGNYGPDLPVTRGQMAVFMQRQAEIPPSAGDILISAGFHNWHPFNSGDPLSFTYFSSQTQVSRSSTGSNFLAINPDLPTGLYGRSLSLKGVVFCFDTFANTALNYVEINTYTHTTGSIGRTLRFSDTTVRTGNACQAYNLPTPVALTPNDGVNFFIQVGWSAGGAPFAIGRTTFVLAATPTVMTPSASRSDTDGTETILQPMPGLNTAAQ